MTASTSSSDERYRLLIEYAPVPHYVHDGKRVLLVNQAFARMLGYPPDELVGRELVDFVHPDFHSVVRERVAQLREADHSGYNAPLLGKMLHADGRLVTVEVVAAKIEYDGRPAIQVVMLDVTEREAAREAVRARDAALQQAAERLAEAQAIARTGNWETDLVTGKVTWSDEIFRILELSNDTVPDLSTWLSVVHPEDRAAQARLRDDILASHKPSNTIFRLQTAGGRIKYVHQHIRFERDASGRVVRLFGTLQDVTEREVAAAERAQLESQLVHAQRLESLGTLASGIAHDFNNLLTVINANVGLAARELPADHPVRDNLREVETASARGAELVRQILTIGRRKPALKQVVTPADVIDEAIGLLRATLPRDVVVETDVAPDAPSIEADPAQLHQVLMNLCTNAWHAFEGGGGRIEVRARGIELDQPDASLDVPTGRYLELEIADTGSGIDAETLERIFDPFFTTKPVGVGSGLGLSVVHGIVKGHGGAIGVDSEPGRGTSFRLVFPAHETVEAPEPVHPGTATDGESLPRVLIVDDEVAIVRAFEKALASLGYSVTAFTEPERALMALTEGSHFDALVLDLRMPGMSGTQLARAARKLAPSVPVVLISGNLDEQVIAEANSIGISRCLPKPCSPAELAAVLAELGVR